LRAFDELTQSTSNRKEHAGMPLVNTILLAELLEHAAFFPIRQVSGCAICSFI
jgi:hypothetical protein